MITIFCYFCQFSAKNLAFFSKAFVIDQIFAKTTASFCKKRQYFLLNFWRKYFLKIITSVTGVAVMITIFGDFFPIIGEKMTFSLKIEVMILSARSWDLFYFKGRQSDIFFKKEVLG
jgi:hypothetical protein